MSKYIDIINEGTVHNLKMIYEQNYVDTVQEVLHGRWETIDKGHFFYDWKCSKCGGSGRADYLFCPYCGSRMDEVEK